MQEVVIAGASRTPMGGFQGALAPLDAPTLGGHAIRAALSTSGADPLRVEELMMGCVLPAGQGQAPARQSGFHAGLGQQVPANTLNKMCGSGMMAAMLAHDRIALGVASLIVAGGMESMTNAPYLLPKMRGGARLGHAQALDHMFLDGLEDAYDRGRLMGTFAEDAALEDNSVGIGERVGRAKSFDNVIARFRLKPMHVLIPSVLDRNELVSFGLNLSEQRWG